MTNKIKSVLILSHPEIDYLSYMTFDGLYKILGKDNITIYPFVNHYIGKVDDWYDLPDGKKGYTEPPQCVTPHDLHIPFTFEEIITKLKQNEFDIIYLSSARRYAEISLVNILKEIQHKDLPPIIFSEGEDYQSLCTVERVQRNYKPLVCFKRELLEPDFNQFNSISNHHLYPLPFSSIIDNIPPDTPHKDKDIDVFALFGNTYPIREDIVKLILSSELSHKYNIHIGIDHFNNEPEKATWQDPNRFNIPPLINRQEYLKLMSRSKINIVARGWGYDTLRRMEAPCYSGLVMSDNIPIMTPYPFTNKKNIIHFSNSLVGLITLIEYYLNHDDERIRIGNNGKEHNYKYHTTEQRAKYFLECIEKHL